MHDDDSLPREEDEGLPEKYWTEEEWEKFLLDNERLMDRYQAVFEEDPERRWDDPSDLYIKVHHGIDLGKDFKDPCSSAEPAEEEDGFPSPADGAVSPQLKESSIMDELENHKLYQSALDFSLALTDWAKAQKTAEDSPEAQTLRELCFHGLKITADIAGGIGLGNEEDSLCGNIVKHRWALAHARETKKRLGQLEGRGRDLAPIRGMLQDLEADLEKEIAALRARVWW